MKIILEELSGLRTLFGDLEGLPPPVIHVRPRETRKELGEFHLSSIKIGIVIYKEAPGPLDEPPSIGLKPSKLFDLVLDKVSSINEWRTYAGARG